MTTRRLFLAGAASLIAAPAIVRAESLMRVVMPKPKGIILILTASDHREDQRAALDRIMRLAPLEPEPYHVALSYLNEVLARGYWTA